MSAVPQTRDPQLGKGLRDGTGAQAAFPARPTPHPVAVGPALCLVRLPCGAAAGLAAFSTAGPGRGFLGLAKSITILFPLFKKFLAIVPSPVPSLFLCVWPLVLKEKKNKPRSVEVSNRTFFKK